MLFQNTEVVDDAEHDTPARRHFRPDDDGSRFARVTLQKYCERAGASPYQKNWPRQSRFPATLTPDTLQLGHIGKRHAQALAP
jgi:hypothetical protein